MRQTRNFVPLCGGGGDPHCWDEPIRIFKAWAIGLLVVVVLFVVVVLLIAFRILPDELRKIL